MKLIQTTVILGVFFLCIASHKSHGQGARYTDSYTKSSPVRYVDKSNFVIEGREISSDNEDAIALYNCENVIVRNNKLGPSALKRGVYLFNCKNITIIDNTFENVQSALVVSRSQGIKFEYNDVTNIIGKLKGSKEMGVMAQFIQVTGSNNSISYNVCENFPGESSPEDLININQSHGTAQSPIIVKGNWIRGGGPSNSGGGINLGDIGGSYQLAEENILVNPGQYGIGISGGKNMTLRNNKVFGSKQYFTNVGIVGANWYENLGQTENITISNNTINYTHKDGYKNNWWFADNVGNIQGKETNKFDPKLTASVLPNKIIGKARTSTPPGSNEGTTPIPDDKPEVTPEPGNSHTPTVPKPGEKPDNPDKKPDTDTTPEDNPDNTEINDASIRIYLDKYNRICVNTSGEIKLGAEVIVQNSKGVNNSLPLTRFHTVLPYKTSPGNYSISAKNGKKTHKKILTIR